LLFDGAGLAGAGLAGAGLAGAGLAGAGPEGTGGGAGGGTVPAETRLAGKIITEAQTRTFLTSNINAPFQELTTVKRYQKSKFN
jgi:hypothetical protein